MTDIDARDISPARPGPHSWLVMLRTEWRLIVRDAGGMVIPLALPLLIMAMNGLGGGASQPIPGTGGKTAMEVFLVPLALVIVVATIATINVPTALAVYRKEGVLRRLGVTPASPGMVLSAHLAVNLLQTLLGIALAMALAVWGFGASLPEDPLAALGAFALVCAAMYAFGMVLAAIAPSTNFALAGGLLSFFALMAVGGGFGTRQNFPEWLDTIGTYTPFGAGMDTLSAAFVGNATDPAQLGVLAGVAVVGALAAMRLFRWT